MSNDFDALLRVENLGRGSPNVVTSPAWLNEGTRRVVDFRSGVVLDHDNLSRSRLPAYSYRDDMCLTGVEGSIVHVSGSNAGCSALAIGACFFSKLSKLSYLHRFLR